MVITLRIWNDEQRSQTKLINRLALAEHTCLIPNTAVKLSSTKSTWDAGPWENRTSPDNMKALA